MIVLSAFIAYLLGSIPSGYLIGKYIYGKDIRREGSGNIGTTNALRTMGRKAGLLTLIFDLLKGWIAVFLASKIAPGILGLAVGAFFAMLGHCFSIFLRFQGGKGVATAAGVLLYIDLLLLFSVLIVFVMFVYFTRIVSIGSIAAAVSAPLFTLFLKEPYEITVAIFLMACVIIYRHKSNIQRILAGTENELKL